MFDVYTVPNTVKQYSSVPYNTEEYNIKYSLYTTPEQNTTQTIINTITTNTHPKFVVQITSTTENENE